MYFTTKHGLLKTVSLLLVLLVVIIGCVGHFESIARDIFGGKGFTGLCKTVPKCPANAMILERFFVSFSIIVFILSAANLIVSVVTDILKENRLADAIYHAVAGALVLIGAALLLDSASRLDKYSPFTRKDMKYGEKIAAGVLGIFSALLYWGTSFVIYQYRD